MAEKVTVMVLKVDLGCPSCYKKIKRVLCKFPEIRDQEFDEKQNTVKITVLYCCPEKIRKRVWSKGGKTIKSIEIKVPEKPKVAEKPKEAEKKKEAEKPKEAEKKKEAEKPKEAEKKKEAEKPKSDGKTDDKPKQAEPAKKAPEAVVKAVEAFPGYPPLYTMGVYSGPYYEGYSGGPSYGGYGMPVGQPQGYEAYGRPIYESYGRPIYEPYGRPIHVNQHDYFSEENPSGCTIM